MIVLGISLVSGCEKSNGSTPAKAPHGAPKHGAQPAKPAAAEDAGTAQSDDEIVPPPDNSRYAPLP